MSKSEPKLVLSIESDEDNEQLDFWCQPLEGNANFNLGLKCSGPMTQENVLDALQYFIDQVMDQGIDLLDFGLSQIKH